MLLKEHRRNKKWNKESGSKDYKCRKKKYLSRKQSLSNLKDILLDRT